MTLNNMEQEKAIETEAPADLIQQTEEVVGHVSQYGDVIIDSVFVFMIGVIAIYLIHAIAAKFLFPHFGKGRLIKVAGGTLYALIIVAVALTVLNRLGVDVTKVGHIALVIIFVTAVLIFFLLPFLPKLPFQIGHLVEFKGELGTVSAISPLYTTLQMFDGTLVFIPNTSIMSMTIKNYSRIASRRIEINLSVRHDSDLDRAKQILVKLMSEDERVSYEPSRPAVFVTKANAVCVDLFAVCWVKNEDWFRTQSDLWEKIVKTFDEEIHLAEPLP